MFTEEHEAITYVHDPATGLHAIIAIHSTVRGPALGGTRVFAYKSEKDALSDVLQLSKAMTFKAAAADLPFGGAKAVILCSPFDPLKRQRLKAFCKFINLFAGNFQTGEDAGTSTEDILFMRQYTKYAHCTPPDQPEHLQTSALTARGVLNGIEASAKFVFGSSDLQKRHVAVQGLGKVGYRLALMLYERGAKLTVCDVNQELVASLRDLIRCDAVTAEEIYSTSCDIFAPCAMGQILNQRTVPQLKARIIAGCANNQLASDEIAKLLHNADILYAPDYVINAGGLISALLEMGIEEEEKMLARVDAIGTHLLRIYEAAKRENLTTLEAADREVRLKLKEGSDA